jgi:hypothetical protein
MIIYETKLCCRTIVPTNDHRKVNNHPNLLGIFRMQLKPKCMSIHNVDLIFY